MMKMDAKKIKAIREGLGMTAAEFGHEVGVAVTTVSRWENGHSTPSRLATMRIERLRHPTPNLTDAVPAAAV